MQYYNYYETGCDRSSFEEVEKVIWTCYNKRKNTQGSPRSLRKIK